MALYTRSALGSTFRLVSNVGRISSFIRHAKPVIAVTNASRNYHLLRSQRLEQHTLSPPTTPHSLTCSCGCSALHSKGRKKIDNLAIINWVLRMCCVYIPNCVHYHELQVFNLMPIFFIGDKELVEFLAEEIAAETKAQKFPKLPALEGFKVTTNGSDICLERTINNET